MNDEEIIEIETKKPDYTGFFSILNSNITKNPSNLIIEEKKQIRAEVTEILLSKTFCDFLEPLYDEFSSIIGPILIGTHEKPNQLQFIIEKNAFGRINGDIRAFAVCVRDLPIPIPHWPQSLSIFINGVPFSPPSPQYSSSSLPFWLDVSKSLKENSNEIRIINGSYRNDITDYFFIVLFRVKSVESIISSLYSVPFWGMEDWKDLFYKTLTSDADCAESWLSISLICPLGNWRMKLPVRGINCEHVSCFDASAYLMFQRSIGDWKCPICQNSCRINELKIDQLLLAVINKFSEEIEKIQFSQQGTVRLCK